MKRIALLLLVFPFAWMAAPRAAQQSPTPPSAIAPDPDVKNDGIPVTSDLVKRKCGTCHRADDKGRMSRISYRRTTPEGWELTIKRMVALNNLKIEPAEARDVLRYLFGPSGTRARRGEARGVRSRAPAGRLSICL